MIWLMRMVRWVRRPPSRQYRNMVAIVLVVCAVLFAVERWVGWPDWATAERFRGLPQVAR
ncbi:hypothetical protein KUH32_12875 [Thalassococcus sp. CAU 1522]|uniref:Uncharacterized protein n=1 Tax=Thalassococcus arenae TaxID=2851652 RepID=A0ABS6NA60_9RHOB|nr:hypothetical protein [Thalassococcus arenae]MBV2360673.1 hypothetical protein [Thalassococcus arenae]